MLKKAAKESVEYQSAHVSLAENAFRGAASLLDKYEEEQAAGTQIPAQVLQLKEQVESNDLVNKYEKIWKKVTKEHAKQNGTLDELLKNKFAALDELIDQIQAKLK